MGLYYEGWAISADDNGSESLPIWCASEYAELVKLDEWADYEPRSIELKEFLSNVLPDLSANSILIAVMYSPNDEGVVVEPKQLAEDIEEELLNY